MDFTHNPSQKRINGNVFRRFSAITCRHFYWISICFDFDISRFSKISHWAELVFDSPKLQLTKVRLLQVMCINIREYVHKYMLKYLRIFATMCEYMLICDVSIYSHIFFEHTFVHIFAYIRKYIFVHIFAYIYLCTNST